MMNGVVESGRFWIKLHHVHVHDVVQEKRKIVKEETECSFEDEHEYDDEDD